jgi:CubicO group peptidase (beta-lactamase class C family)
MSRLISVLDGTTGVLTLDDVHDMISASLPVASRPGSTSRYGLGLEVTRLDAGHSLLWHSGQRPGISSFAGFIPEKGVSVALATNIADAPSVGIGHQILAEVLHGGLDPRSCQWPPPAIETRPEQPKRFCGDFGSLEFPDLSVCLDEGHLVLDMGATRDRLQFAGPSHGTVGAQTFCFLGDGGPATDGEVPTALAVDLRILPRHGCAGGRGDHTLFSIPTSKRRLT